MGIKKTLPIDKDLKNAVQMALDNWKAGFAPPTCTGKGKEECNLENEVRNNLSTIGANVFLGTASKKCCGSSAAGRKNCIRFDYYYEYWNAVGGWAPAKYPKSPFCTSFSNDIYYSHSGKNVIVEIKIISHRSNCMSYLMSGTPPQDHIIPKHHHFVLPCAYSPSPITINKPVEICPTTRKVTYFSYFAEGQLWMDILRMAQAKNYFSQNTDNNFELYLLLFSDSPLPITKGNYTSLENTLNIFDDRYDWLFHDYKGALFRSKTVKYDYFYQPIPATTGGSHQAFLVRIEPT